MPRSGWSNVSAGYLEGRATLYLPAPWNNVFSNNKLVLLPLIEYNLSIHAHLLGLTNYCCLVMLAFHLPCPSKSSYVFLFVWPHPWMLCIVHGRICVDHIMIIMITIVQVSPSGSRCVQALSWLCSVQVTIYLTSPSGTRSTLLSRRSYDRSADGFNSWSFMTTHCWGESPNGIWRLEIRNGDSVGNYWWQ